MLGAALLLSLLVLAYGETVLTPFGYRPSECVLEVPHGSTVIPGEGDQLIISSPETEGVAASVRYYKAPPHCGDDIQKIHQKKS